MTLEIRRNPLLAERTTLRLGGTALAEAVLRDDADLDAVARLLEAEGGAPLRLGWGSNLLARDGELPLVLLKVDNATGPVVDEGPEHVTVRTGAGLGMPVLLAKMQQAGLAGLERLAGIPGSVGGAAAMNAGSYGAEFGALLRRVRLWTPERGLFWKDAAECTFGYRHFDPGLSGLWLVWEVELRLARKSPDAIKDVMRETMRRKSSTQPVTAHSAGCLFRNPEGQSAGRLLDEAGFRGRRIGNMAFSELHANFLVNIREMGVPSRSEDALELIALAREAVLKRFDIALEMEVVVVP